MIINEKTILVSWDFSENAKHALSHALFYSSQTNFDIYLLHVVKDKAKAKEDFDKEITPEQKRMAAIIFAVLISLVILGIVFVLVF